ncbi:MAG: HEPN domain-containing protein [Sedimentisphaerales bacterium]|jgi:HEPN domain-containing protein
MMLNVPKQVEYWVGTAEEDFEVGSNLIKANKTRHGLFFIHLAVEKMLKACVCKNQKRTPPKIHRLLSLAKMAGIELDNEQTDLLTEINEFNLEGRYPPGFCQNARQKLSH